MQDTDRFARPQVSFADLTPTTAPTWSKTTVPTLPTLRPAQVSGGKRLARGTVPSLPALRSRPPTILVQDLPDAPALPIRVVLARRWGHVEHVRLVGDVNPAPARVPHDDLSSDPRPVVAVLAITIAALLAILATSRTDERASEPTAAAGIAVRSHALASPVTAATTAPPVVITELPEPVDEPEIEIELPPRVTAPRRPARPRPAPAVASAPTRKTADVDGALSISAKPPCRIIVDGRDTGMTTPQRELRLPAGRHEVTLINAEYGVEDRSTVMIGAGTTTKLVRDLSAHLGS